MAAKPRDQDKYNWQDVYTYSTNEVYDCKKGILPTKGKKGGREGSLGSVNTTEGDLKNQDKVGWLTRKVQGFGPCVCQQQIGVWRFGTILHHITY